VVPAFFSEQTVRDFFFSMGRQPDAVVFSPPCRCNVLHKGWRRFPLSFPIEIGWRLCLCMTATPSSLPPFLFPFKAGTDLKVAYSLSKLLRVCLFFLYTRIWTRHFSFPPPCRSSVFSSELRSFSLTQRLPEFFQRATI